MTRMLLAVLSISAFSTVATAVPYELVAGKNRYAPGETVKMRFINYYDGPLTLKTNAPVITNAAGNVVHFPSAIGLEILILVPNIVVPKGGHYPNDWWTWDQKDGAGKSVPAGTYTASLTVKPSGGGAPFVVKKSFAIGGASSGWGLALTTNRPVYAPGPGEGITITVQNQSDKAVGLSTGFWRVWRENKKVYDSYLPGSMSFFQLKPGDSKTVVWNKKGQAGKYVGSGSYRIELTGFSPPISRMIALVPGGSIAGTTLFPLSVGNTWVYHRTDQEEAPNVTGAPETVKVASQKASGWFQVQNLGTTNRWVRMKGATVQAQSKGTLHDLFAFGKPAGHSYVFPSLDDYLGGTLKVAALNQGVTTPAGTFQGCTRIDVLQSLSGFDVEFESLWFAPGIGLVRYSLVDSNEAHPVYSLHHASLRGSDKKVYTIGLK